MADEINLLTEETRDLFRSGIQANAGGLIANAIYEAIADAEDVAAIADGAMATFNIAATGVRKGDRILAVTPPDGLLLVAGVFLTAQVTANDTITVSIHNESGGAVGDVAAGDYHVLVMPKAA